MNVLPIKEKTKILQALVEGCSIRSAERMTGHHRDTIMRLLIHAGRKSEMLLDSIKGIQAEHIQIDELWTFVGKKNKMLAPEEMSNKRLGTQFVFVAMDRKTKLIPNFRLGKRDIKTVYPFIWDLKKRLKGHTHITTDSYKPYIGAIMRAFGIDDVSYTQLLKAYASNGNPRREGYSPVDFVMTIKTVMFGNPPLNQISTSHIERQNLTLRMCLRRLTRLTNGFSKKFENLKAALNLHFSYYNFCRIHGSLGTTPAMKVGITDHLWTLKDVIKLLEKKEISN
jgi:IS1 family transposase